MEQGTANQPWHTPIRSETLYNMGRSWALWSELSLQCGPWRYSTFVLCPIPHKIAGNSDLILKSDALWGNEIMRRWPSAKPKETTNGTRILEFVERACWEANKFEEGMVVTCEGLFADLRSEPDQQPVSLPWWMIRLLIALKLMFDTRPDPGHGKSV